MKECIEEKTLQICNCTWDPCSRKGICCECIQYHWNMGELPACLFPNEVEKTYDRSIKRFIELYEDKA